MKVTSCLRDIELLWEKHCTMFLDRMDPPISQLGANLCHHLMAHLVFSKVTMDLNSSASQEDVSLEDMSLGFLLYHCFPANMDSKPLNWNPNKLFLLSSLSLITATEK